MFEFIDGKTPINREAMMAIQGFFDVDGLILDDGTIVKTNSKGHTLTITPFNVDGIRTTTYIGEKTIVLKTMLNADGTISEVLE